MKSYSEREIFTFHELLLFHQANCYIDAVRKIVDDSVEIRCHELARAVGLLLNLPYQDGYYGFVDHTWLWTAPLPTTIIGRINFPNILDVYSVGSLPMVRLVDARHTSLPHVGWAYRPDKERTDINMQLVHVLVNRMRAVSEQVTLEDKEP
jgi:hypothetical protein